MGTEGIQKKILVVDDEKDIADSLTALLETRGFRVLNASSGEAGFEIARNELPDLILLDVFLPGENGFDTLKKLKRPVDPLTGESSTTRNIPVIIMTGPGEQMGDMFQMEEAFAFMTKPFESKTLFEAIQRALSQK